MNPQDRYIVVSVSDNTDLGGLLQDLDVSEDYDKVEDAMYLAELLALNPRFSDVRVCKVLRTYEPSKQ